MRDVLVDLFMVGANLVLALPGHRLRVGFLRRVCGWTVGDGTVIERRLRITTKGGVEIGRGCVVNRGVVLDGRGGLVIGDDVNISPEVACLTADHDPESPEFRARLRPVTIGSRSWLATRSMVLPGATVGEGCVVAAGAVVTGETPEWSVVAGVPARKLSSRPTNAQRRVPTYRRWLH